jgi:endonuclease/exonuclease/phosphatase (EEP) superfamily protein YafD
MDFIYTEYVQMFKSRYSPKFPKYFDRFSWTMAGLITIVTLLGFLGRFHWALDLLSHFRVQYLQLALLVAGICLWVRRNKCAVVLIGIAAFNYAFVLPLYMGKPDTSGAQNPPVRAMLMNLNASNGNTEQVLKAIQSADPDFLVLEEVTPTWAFELSKLSEAYPHHLVEPREGCFGITLLSKLPLSQGKVVEIGSAGVPSILATAHLPQGDCSIIATHPVPPLGAEFSAHRNNQLAKLPEIIKAQKHPVLLVGDLNTSPWSPYFSMLLRESGLQDSMKGFGFQPTWPSGNPLSRIPIDHMLHTPDNRMVGGDVGSDHLPLIVDFSMK